MVRGVVRRSRPARATAAAGALALVAGLVAALGTSGAAAQGATGAVARPAAAAAPTPVQVWLTTTDGRNAITAQPAVSLGPLATGATNVVVDDSKSYQTMDGFGAAFTDSSTYLLGTKLSTTQRAEVMTKLFDPVKGIGLSFMRLPMAASDFTACQCDYSYDDVPAGQSDPGLTRFSVDRDREYTIPVIKQAQALNPGMKLFANPWSPPAWMKTNGSMVARLGNGPVGTLKDEYQDALAQYFVKFLRAYSEAGVSVWGITPQNEPGVLTTDYPGEDWPAEREAAFISGHLVPALKSAGLSPAILGFDSNWESPQYPRTLLADPGTRAALAGIAWHGYAGDPAVMTQSHNTSGLDQYETECSQPICRGGPDQLAIKVAMSSVQNWARGVQTWNLALDPDGGPKHGTGCTNCNGLATVDQATGAVSYTAVYTALGQFSKFVRPGAVHIGSTQNTEGVQTAAFRNPDGGESLVAWNSAADARTFTTSWNSRGSFGYTLPAGAIATFTVAGAEPAPIVSSTYAFLNGADGRAMSVADGSTANRAKLVPAPDTDAATQRWTVRATGDGYYRIAAPGGRVVDDAGFSTAPGNQMQLWDLTPGNTNQQWWAQSGADGYVTFVNRLSGLVLTASGSAVVQATADGSAAQRWRLAAVPVAGTSYRIVNRNSGKGLGIPGGTKAPGDPVQQFVDSSNPDQTWTLQPTTGGNVGLRNAGSGLLAGVAGASTTQLAKVVQFTANGSPDQEWLPVRTGPYVVFTNRNSGQELGIDGGFVADAAPAVQFPRNGSPDHQWSLVPLGPVSVQPSVPRPTPGGPAPTYRLLTSTSGSHTGGTALDGARVTGPVYAFVPDAGGIASVRFSVDGKLVRTEAQAAYDLGGTSASGAGQALPLTAGAHTVAAVVTPTSGSPVTLTARFTVAT